MQNECNQAMESTQCSAPPRDLLPWAQINESERLERMRQIIKGRERDMDRLRGELYRLRQMVMSHRHGQDESILVPANHDVLESAGCCDSPKSIPGQEWF